MKFDRKKSSMKASKLVVPDEFVPKVGGQQPMDLSSWKVAVHHRVRSTFPIDASVVDSSCKAHSTNRSKRSVHRLPKDAERQITL
jgi:hypothetical protein